MRMHKKTRKQGWLLAFKKRKQKTQDGISAPYKWWLLLLLLLFQQHICQKLFCLVHVKKRLFLTSCVFWYACIFFLFWYNWLPSCRVSNSLFKKHPRKHQYWGFRHGRKVHQYYFKHFAQIREYWYFTTGILLTLARTLGVGAHAGWPSECSAEECYNNCSLDSIGQDVHHDLIIHRPAFLQELQCLGPQLASHRRLQLTHTSTWYTFLQQCKSTWTSVPVKYNYIICILFCFRKQ